MPNKWIDPYFWQTPSNALITGLEEEETLNACDPYFWQKIHIFGKAPRFRFFGQTAKFGPKLAFWPSIGIFGPFGPMADQKRCEQGA